MTMFQSGCLVAALASDMSSLVTLGLIVAAFAAAGIAGLRAYRRPYTRPGRWLGPIDPVNVDLQPPESRLMTRLEKALIFGLAGYLFFDRGFAWFHIPGTPLFIGELIIAFGVIAVLGSTVRISPAIKASGAFKALIAYMIWGAFLLVPAIPTYSFRYWVLGGLWWPIPNRRRPSIWYPRPLTTASTTLMWPPATATPKSA